MIIAQLSIYPISEGTSVGKYVHAAYKVLEESGLKIIPGPMSTALEAPDLDTIFTLVKKAENAILQMGARRVIIELKIDDRRDKDATMEKKKEKLVHG